MMSVVKICDALIHGIGFGGETDCGGCDDDL